VEFRTILFLLQLVALSAENRKVAFSLVSILLHMWEVLGSNPISLIVLTKDFVGIFLCAANTVLGADRRRYSCAMSHVCTAHTA
jgi:hypothetical protein